MEQEVESIEYEFTRTNTTAMMRHELTQPLKKARLHVHNGSKEGVFTELDFGEIVKRAAEGDFVVKRGYQLAVSLKGYRADVLGSLEVDDDIHSCVVELMRQTNNGWERDDDVPYTLTLTY